MRENFLFKLRREHSMNMLMPHNFLLFCFQWCTGIPDGIVELVGKEVYSEKLNQKGRNIE